MWKLPRLASPSSSRCATNTRAPLPHIWADAAVGVAVVHEPGSHVRLVGDVGMAVRPGDDEDAIGADALMAIAQSANQ